jgi:hypothetical protein
VLEVVFKQVVWVIPIPTISFEVSLAQQAGDAEKQRDSTNATTGSQESKHNTCLRLKYMPCSWSFSM